MSHFGNLFGQDEYPINSVPGVQSYSVWFENPEVLGKDVDTAFTQSENGTDMLKRNPFFC